METNCIISQLEVYDQIWYAREGDVGNGHSAKATELAKKIVEMLEEDEGNAETFPFETIDTLKTVNNSKTKIIPKNSCMNLIKIEFQKIF